MSPLTPPAMSDAEKKSDAASADTEHADKNISNRTKPWLLGDSECGEDDGAQADPEAPVVSDADWAEDSPGAQADHLSSDEASVPPSGEE